MPACSRRGLGAQSGKDVPTKEDDPVYHRHLGRSDMPFPPRLSAEKPCGGVLHKTGQRDRAQLVVLAYERRGWFGWGTADDLALPALRLEAKLRLEADQRHNQPLTPRGAVGARSRAGEAVPLVQTPCAQHHVVGVV